MSDSVKRQARIAVLEVLYECETSGHDPEAVYKRHIEAAAEADRKLAGPGPSAFGLSILRGVVARKAELDPYIAEAAPRFPVQSLAVVDRNILRLAIWELLSDTSAPVAAVVNEAVELAHRYGGETTPAFINGVLRTVTRRIESARADTPPGPAPEIEHAGVDHVSTVFERVRAIVVEQLGVEEAEVVPNASFVDDLNADSLDLVELIMSLEEEFTGEGPAIEISDEDAEKIATVQDAVDYLKDHGVEES